MRKPRTRLQMIRRADRRERTAVEFRHDVERWRLMRWPDQYTCNIVARREELTDLIFPIL